jgi:sec-independent protein translocase protein TatA
MFHGQIIPFLIVVALIVLLFGGKKLPELAKGVGEGIREFKKATQGDDDSARKTEDAAKSSGGAKSA